MNIPIERFEQLVSDALDLIPDDLAQQMDNVIIRVVPEPEPGDEDLLGLYHGIPLTERGNYSNTLPDMIDIYYGPITRMCSSEEEIVEEVRITVLHEVAHHFGIDDEELHRLGWA